MPGGRRVGSGWRRSRRTPLSYYGRMKATNRARGGRSGLISTAVGGCCTPGQESVSAGVTGKSSLLREIRFAIFGFGGMRLFSRGDLRRRRRLDQATGRLLDEPTRGAVSCQRRAEGTRRGGREPIAAFVEARRQHGEPLPEPRVFAAIYRSSSVVLLILAVGRRRGAGDVVARAIADEDAARYRDSPLPMRIAAPGWRSRKASCTRGISGLSVSNLLLRAVSSTTVSAILLKSCWYCRLRSTVMNASKSRSAKRSNAPFLTPDHPASVTVTTVCPGSECLSFFGKHSSSSIRIVLGEDSGLRELQDLRCLLAGNRGEILEKVV